MEYISIALSALAVILTFIVLIISLKNKKTGDITIGENELRKIRESVNEPINLLSTSVSNLVAEKNSALMDSLNKKIDDLIKTQSELIKDQERFREDFIKLFSDFEKKYITDIIRKP